jgi:hypothetical protein
MRKKSQEGRFLPMVNILTHIRTTDASGSFCFEVAAGTYKVSPVIEAKEQAAGLLLNPRVSRVVVTTNPIMDLVFNQVSVELGSRINILGSCYCKWKSSLR